MSKWLIAVMTCQRPLNQTKANAQRWSWVEDVRRRGIADVFFFHGTAHGEMFGSWEDQIGLPVDDSYAGIPRKVQEMFAWGIKKNYDRISKCDDDVYAVPQRLDTLPLDGDYVGRFRAPYGNYPAHFASGFFYTLSRKAATIVAKAKYNGDWMDERFVANTLAYNNIFGKHDGSSYVVSGPFTKPEDVPRLVGTRSGAVYCQYGAKELLQMHELLGQPARHYHGGIQKLDDVPRVKVTTEMLAAPPSDKMPAEKGE